MQYQVLWIIWNFNNIEIKCRLLVNEHGMIRFNGTTEEVINNEIHLVHGYKHNLG